MSGLVSIHQPNFLPWPGYWLKQAIADVHVVHANCALNLSGFTRRVRIYTQEQHPSWLSVPLEKSSSGSLISQTCVHNSPEDQRRLLKSLTGNYACLPYFSSLKNRLQVALLELAEKPDLATYNQGLAKALAPTFFESGLKMVSDATLSLMHKKGPMRVVEICERVDASTYISGLGAMNYLADHHFASSSTRLVWFDAAAASQQIFPEVRVDESVVRIISLIGEQAFTERLKSYRVRYLKALHERLSK